MVPNQDSFAQFWQPENALVFWKMARITLKYLSDLENEAGCKKDNVSHYHSSIVRVRV